MSFLLRKPSRGVPSTRAQPPPHRSVATKNSVRPRAAVGGAPPPQQQQQQQLLQRRPAATQQQRMTQTTVKRTQQVSKGDQEELQGVISMEEVMSDLRVLEQQQRESQRKLAIIKRTKQAKLKQRSALDSKLSSLKYANGEQRAQLTRARDVLSRSTRELGLVALRADKSADALKGFNSRLDKTLLSSRILHGLCRKVDSEIIVLRNKMTVILRLKKQVMDKMNATRERYNDVKNRELSLRKSIQEEKIKAKALIDKTTIIRSDVTGLGQDLSTAEQMATSTKIRAESIAVEVIAEDTRHEAATKDMHLKLEAANKQLAEKKAREEAVRKEIELKQAQLREAWKRCVQYQQEEGLDVSPEPTDDGPVPSLDVDKLNALLTQERAALLAATAERDRLKGTLASSNEELSQLDSKKAAAREEAESIRKEAQAARKVESDRRQTHDQCLEELEKERQSVSDLRRSVLELEESNRSERKRLDAKSTEQAETIKKRKAELEESKTNLAAALETIQDVETGLEKDEADNARLVESAKRGADDARSAFEEARHEANVLETASHEDIQREVQDIEEAQRILAEDADDEIAQLCEEYPSLEDVEVHYDADKSREEIADEALFDLRAVCEARIAQARAQKEAAKRKSLALRKEKEAAERKAQLKAQRKEAEASQRRKEERRNERRRKEAKQRESLQDNDGETLKPACSDDGGKYKRRSSSSSAGGILSSIQDKHADYVDKLPAPSQKRIRFEDEEEVSSLITKEPGDSRIRETKRTYGKNRSSAHSRRESSSSLKSKQRESVLKESSRSRSVSRSDKTSKARDEASKSSNKNDGVKDSQSTKNRSSKDHRSRPPSLSPEARPTKRQKENVSDSATAVHATGSRTSGGRSSTANFSKVDSKHKAQGRKTHSSSISTGKSSNRESRMSSNDDSHSLASQSMKTHTSSRSSTSKSSSRKSREPKPGKPDDSRSVSSRSKMSSSHKTKAGASQLASSRAKTSRSSSREGREAKKPGKNAPEASHKSKSHSSSRSVSSQKSSRSKSSQKSSRSVLDPQQKFSGKRKASRRPETDCASQASGISTMERASKSRRRKKKDAPTTNKSKMSSLSMEDVDFHF